MNQPKASTATSQSSATSRKRWTIIRRCVQVTFLVLFTIPVLLVGWSLFGSTAGGVDPFPTPAELPFYGTLSSSEILGINLLDPFAVLQTIAASKTFMLDWLIFALPILILYAVIRGRAFCGWVCPVNLFMEGVDFLRRKMKINVKEMALPRHVKIYVALAVVAVSLVISVPIFEVFSPISAINKGIVLGSTAGIVVLVAIVVVELFWGHRVWCRSLCPLGGFYEVIGKVGLFNVQIKHDDCIHCGLCQKKCLVDPEILDPVLEDKTRSVLAGDCMVCGACVDVCPTKALSVRPNLDHFKRQ